MSVFRRPHDYRHPLVAVAVLFPAPADPAVLARPGIQEQFWASDRVAPAVPRRFALAAPLIPDPALTPDPPQLRQPAASRYWDGLRPYAYPAQRAFAPIFFNDLGDALAPASWRPGPQTLPASHPATRRFPAALFNALGDTVPPRRQSQPNWSPAAAAAAQGSLFLPALFPAGVPDSPPLVRSLAQEAFWAALRLLPSMPQGFALSPTLYPPPEAPPLVRTFSQEAFWALQRIVPPPPQAFPLVPGLFPPPEDPALRQSFAQQLVHAGLKPWPYPRQRVFDLAAFLVEAPTVPTFEVTAAARLAAIERRINELLANDKDFKRMLGQILEYVLELDKKVRRIK